MNAATPTTLTQLAQQLRTIGQQKNSPTYADWASLIDQAHDEIGQLKLKVALGSEGANRVLSRDLATAVVNLGSIKQAVREFIQAYDAEPSHARQMKCGLALESLREMVKEES